MNVNNSRAESTASWTGPAPAPEAEPLATVVAVLIEALRALGDRGRAEAANRLAGRAYASLRRTRPDLAQRINGLMHRLSRIQERQQGADHA